MRKLHICIIAMTLAVMAPVSLYSQKNQNSINQITSSDLESYVSFLASPLLKGRMNGEEGLEIAAQYIASQAKLTGLKPANGTSYFQPYAVMKKTMDPNKTKVQIISNGKDTVTVKEPMFQLVPTGPSDFTLDGEVVFAGYGIKADKYKYNDFDNLKTEGKILLVMDRAPMSENGEKCLFEEPNWSSAMSFQMKLTTMIYSKAKAILFVSDPKSGFQSFDESNPGIAGYLKSKVTLSSEKPEIVNPFMAGMPKVIFIHRIVADELLKGSGHSLEELQKSIDSTLQPHSFTITDKLLKINEVSLLEEKVLNNVAGYIEGSDPVLKNEIVVFSGHYDHIGASGSKINTGADDDASGCAALLSMAEAFQSLEKKPLRSILFLWVSGEEIGLYGSKSYVDNPLFPLEKTVADLNMDMIGRVKGVADSTKENPMTGPNTVFVITDSQSKDLRSIADEIDKKSPLDFDYSLSGRDHPLQLFARSDHYNFVEKDIPVLFFTTGLHTDYHTPGDVVEKIDFKKMEMITRTMFEIGLTVANRKTRLIVDNPFSSWGKSK
ncbi:MAG: M28 family peptidase [Bacteroidetes bacterium]|nr:M28 family peptidase [Bacteroidota bacterium]